jgi:hypothetical protein
MANPIAGSSDMATVLIATPSRRSLRNGLIEEPIEGFFQLSKLDEKNNIFIEGIN